MATLQTGRSPYFPPCFVRSAKYELFVLNGVDSPQRWNGLTASSQNMGIIAPTTACTIAGSGSGSITGTYTAYVRFMDAESIPSSLSPISNEITVASKGQIDYTSVPVSTNSRVTQRQIWRNTTGQSTTYYLDTTIADNVTTTATGTKTDTQLEASTELPLLNADGSINADRFTYYPVWKAFIATLHDRFWAAGDVTYTIGNVQVTNGSATVTGIGSAFTSSFIDRIFYVVGDTASYTISAVNVGAQTLTLSTTYAGTTNLFAMYAIKVHKDERNKVYFSAAGEPESMPSVYNFKIQEIDDGDEITGLMPLGTYLFVLMQRHIFRVSFTSSPLDDVGSHLTVSRGCVNNRCWVRVEDIVYMLDREGVHRFQGGHNGGETDHISEPIQDYFRDGKINWRASKWFFGSQNPREEVVRFHVALGGEYLPRFALCYHYRHKAWWIEEYPWQMGGYCLVNMNGALQCLLGGQYFKVYIQTGNLDGPTDVAPGDTLRAAVDSATLLSITDSDAVFPASGVVGAPLAIVSGRGKGQVRRITAATSTRLSILNPWSILPDTTSVYQIGGIKWRIKSALFRLANAVSDNENESDVNYSRRIVLNVQPTPTTATVDVRQYLNHADSPRTDLVAQDEGAGVVTTEGEADAVMSISGASATDIATGRAYDSFSGYRHLAFNRKGTDPRWSDNWLAAELRGVQGRDKVIIYELGIVGVEGGQ